MRIYAGGGFERDLAESYDYRNGRFYTGMCVLEVLLADQYAGAGGLCIVPVSTLMIICAPSCRQRSQFDEQTCNIMLLWLCVYHYYAGLA